MSVAALTDLRSTLAGVLAPASSSDPEVLPYQPHAVAPPVLVVRWGDPWLEQDASTGQCRYAARLEVWALVQRNEPESATPELESIVSTVLRKLAGDTYPWRVSASVPGDIVDAGITYFGCRLTVSAPAIPNPEE